MRRYRTSAIAVLLAVVFAAAVHGAAYVTVGPPEVTDVAGGKQFVQPVTLANEIASYTLTYDITQDPEKPDEVSSGQWAWTVGYISLGMTEPSMPNWYYQGFFNWYFDEESLHNRPAKLRVIRQSGEDGMVEYLWDTPKVRASIRFAMVGGSDKLLVFGSYEPKEPVGRSYLKFTCYPAFFPEPRQRSVTTALGTRLPGEVVRLDLAQERWILYEDTSEGRPGSGSAGMLIGTPEAFASVEVPVGAYGITTTLELAPDQREFALALYDLPSLPDYRVTREYFREVATAEAEAFEQMAAGDLDEPLPPLPTDPERVAALVKAGEEMFDRPAETWRPDPETLPFSWVRELPGEPLKTVLFCPRWAAWETMELARRLPMEVQHLYFDRYSILTSTKAWPYRTATGIGPIPFGIAARKAASLATDPEAELFLCAGVYAEAIPGVSRAGITAQVKEGKGLLLVGPTQVSSGWPKDMFETEQPEVAEDILACFDWEMIPGFREGERGRVGEGPPLKVYRYGEGRVVVLTVSLHNFSSLVPRNEVSEGNEGAMDRALALCARAALAAVGREPACSLDLRPDEGEGTRLPVAITPAAPAGSTLLVRVQDDLDRVIDTRALDLPLAEGRVELPVIPPNRQCFLDAMVRDAEGRCLGFASAALPRVEGPTITDISIQPSTLSHEVSVPMVDLPAGGELVCSATVENAEQLAGAQLTWEVRDALDRVLASAITPAPPAGVRVTATMPAGRPVTVCHRLDISLEVGGRVLDFARQRFTMRVPYPYDDFTALMWTTVGGAPLLRRTDRFCYEWGADMGDLANTLRADDGTAAREYSLTARSGLRLVPYVTRISGEANQDNERVPCLHDPAYLDAQRECLTANSRQAAPYQPAAYTLGDENFLMRAKGECCHRPESVEAFRAWLEEKYGNIAALNRIWDTNYRSLAVIEEPMLLAEAAEQQVSFAPWLDHKVFMDDAFVGTHELFADIIRAQDPGAKVGWDGILSYHWGAGYDFTKLTANLELNQTYTGQWLQGEFVRSFKRPDALTGKWGNRVADNEAGWSAFPWDCLLKGDNSVWWWTSWGCDYTPFNPDLSQNNFGRWFFAAARETTAGPGKLLLHAERDDSRIAVLYSQQDLFAAAIVGQLVEGAAFAGDRSFLKEHEAILKGIKDLGCQFRHFSVPNLEQGRIPPDDYPVLILPCASCISDAQVAALREFVEAGGTLVVDGRAGLLTGDGVIRQTRALDEILGVEGVAGIEGFKQASVTAEVAIEGSLRGLVASQALQLEVFEVEVLEPGLKTTTGQALAEVNGAPILITNRLGDGCAITLNLALVSLPGSRMEEDTKPLHEIISAVLHGAGLRPPCQLTCPDGARPRCVQQVLFTDGALRYLALQQDILLPGLPDQQAHVTLPAPAIVYDLRSGERVGEGQVAEWEVTLSRGGPLVYSLLPYEVTEVIAEAPASASTGGSVPVKGQVKVSAGAPGYHVVRLNVYSPGSETPHRQYSQNLSCPDGSGAGDIPFALSDERGEWRLELRDVASGVTAVRSLLLK